jgi:hypothetical protein
MSVVLLGSTSGSVTLQEPAIAGSTVITLPATSGTMASIATVNNNGVVYANSSGQPTTTSTFVFDGTNVGIGYTSMNTTIAVNGNALFGTGTWPTNDFGRSGSRFLNTSSTEDGILASVNMQSGVGASRGGYLYLGARATTGVDGATFATIGGIRENATSGNYASALTFNTSTSAGVTTERARFNSTGALVLAGGSTSANGVGITFPATQSASTDANTLDDYEEGSWTPSFTSDGGTTGTQTNTSVWGRYIKIGRQVTVWFKWNGTLSGYTGTLQISGLPFSVGTSTDAYQYGGNFYSVSSTATASNGVNFLFFAYSGSLYPVYTTGQSGAYLFTGSSQINGLTEFYGSHTYYALA